MPDAKTTNNIISADAARRIHNNSNASNFGILLDVEKAKLTNLVFDEFAGPISNEYNFTISVKTSNGKIEGKLTLGSGDRQKVVSKEDFNKLIPKLKVAGQKISELVGENETKALLAQADIKSDDPDKYSKLAIWVLATRTGINPSANEDNSISFICDGKIDDKDLDAAQALKDNKTLIEKRKIASELNDFFLGKGDNAIAYNPDIKVSNTPAAPPQNNQSNGGQEVATAPAKKPGIFGKMAQVAGSPFGQMALSIVAPLLLQKLFGGANQYGDPSLALAQQQGLAGLYGSGYPLGALGNPYLPGRGFGWNRYSAFASPWRDWRRTSFSSWRANLAATGYSSFRHYPLSRGGWRA